MKFSIAAALTLASFAYSQTVASETALIPPCALTPLSNAITGAGCGLTDYVCQCGTAKSAITTAATPSILAACSTQDALTTQQITAEICNLVTGGSASSSTDGAAPTAASSSMASSIASSMASSASIHTSPHASSASISATHVSSSATSASSAAAAKTNAASSNLNAANILAGVGFFAALAL